jgi:aspartate carbamoyltransferase
MGNRFFNKSFVSVDALNISDIRLVFEKAKSIRNTLQNNKHLNSAKGKVLAALFYEPSSRTFSSFLTAMQKIGGGIVPLNSMVNTSVYKGETLEDTIRVFSEIADVIVLRHPEAGAAKTAASVARIPVINAGDGSGEHPSQALLDSLTVSHHFPSFAPITVGMIGDLLYGRTVHSLSKTLAVLGVKKFIFISPSLLKMPQKIKDVLRSYGASVVETNDLASCLADLDVIYQTRVQKERFTDQNEYEKLKLSYVITPKLLQKAKKTAILMHPLPRVGEITSDVDADPRALYFREEIQNGVFIRAALLDLILNK